MDKLEGYWDCPYCNRKANKGRYRNCPGCGKTRGKDIKFYLIEKDVYVPEENVPKGPDWLYECCDSYNTSSADYCVSCGAPKGAAKDYFEMQPKEEDMAWLNQTSQEENHSLKGFTKKGLNFKPLIISACVILAFVLFITILLPKTAIMKVTELSWTRSIEIEEYKTVRESGWTLPSGGRMVYTNLEVKSYIQVLDHYETKTVSKSETYISGYQTQTKQVPVYRSDPVYATKYYYDIERWKYDRTETSSGVDGEPYWPEVSLSDKEREGKKHQKYFVKVYSILDQKKEEKSYTISYELWEQLRVNDEISATVSFGKITKFEKK